MTTRSEQLVALHAASRLQTELVGDISLADGIGEMTLALPSHAVCLLQLVPD